MSTTKPSSSWVYVHHHLLQIHPFGSQSPQWHCCKIVLWDFENEMENAELPECLSQILIIFIDFVTQSFWNINLTDLEPSWIVNSSNISAENEVHLLMGTLPASGEDECCLILDVSLHLQFSIRTRDTFKT